MCRYCRRKDVVLLTKNYHFRVAGTSDMINYTISIFNFVLIQFFAIDILPDAKCGFFMSAPCYMRIQGSDRVPDPVSET